MEIKEFKRVLWTGGWDSTYRMVELSFRNVDIEPIYVVDPGRISSTLELQAMDKILELIRKKPETKAVFEPVKQICLKDIPENNEISQAYNVFSEKTGLGSQHDWLARLALLYPKIELCIEKATSGHMPVRDAINADGAVISIDDGYIIDKENSSKELQLLFGNFSLPIFEKTEQDMLNDIKKWGYEDIMSNIWFCHTPLKGNKICGVCNPCCTKANYHMDFLLTDAALKRNKRLKIVQKIFGKYGGYVYKRLVRYFCKD